MVKLITQWVTKAIFILIHVYQKVISPLIPARCRYYPTCSEYGKYAILWHGPYKGLLLTARRISSCHPLGGQGIDFVPLPLYKEVFTLFNSDLFNTYPNTSSHSHLIYHQATNLIPERGIFVDNSSYVARLNHLMLIAN